MARISGLNIPKEKKVKVSITYVYGIGPAIAKEVLDKAKIDGEKRVHELTNEEVIELQKAVQDYTLEGELRRSVKEDLQRLQKIGSYRGLRHKKGLPVRGQRTKTNAKTRKGKSRPIVNKKKV